MEQFQFPRTAKYGHTNFKIVFSDPENPPESGPEGRRGASEASGATARMDFRYFLMDLIH